MLEKYMPRNFASLFSLKSRCLPKDCSFSSTGHEPKKFTLPLSQNSVCFHLPNKKEASKSEFKKNFSNLFLSSCLSALGFCNSPV